MSQRFVLQQQADGQIYISEDDKPQLHAQINDDGTVEIQIGSDRQVVIDKLYGPMVFWSLRVSCDLATCEWIIERNMGPNGDWKEWIRIPGQLATDFN